MRIIPHDISDRVARTMQTKANNANPSADIWIGRPNTALMSDSFLERQSIFESPVTDVSIAVCHPRYKRDNTMVFVGYISNGKARVISALTKVKMEDHTWLRHEFEEDASSISVTFNGKMHTGADGIVEFETDLSPWVFWVTDGVLYAKILDSPDESVCLANANCTDVSSVCITDGSVGGFDFGLVVFFVLSGTLYYRQLIQGEWMDAVPVSSAPDGVVAIAAFRTWDHRIGVQMQTSEGKTYELYTQYMGIGKRSEEHVDMSVYAAGKYTAITYHDTSMSENVNVAEVTAMGGMLYGLSSVPVSVCNVDNGEGDYGYFVEITLDRPVTNVENHSESFSLVDLTSGIQYVCIASHSSNDGLTIVLEFMNFNLSQDNDMKISYTPGSIQCIVAPLSAFEYTFTPENLVRPDIPIPEPVSAVNIDSSGIEIALSFSQDLLTFNLDKNVENFGITMQQYDFVPNGSIIESTRTVKALRAGDSDDVLIITLAAGSMRSIRNAVGDVTITYSGGTLYGEGGPVSDFEFSFTPSGLSAKNNPNVSDHMEIGDISAQGVLTKITYRDSSFEENVKIGDITATGVLTHIDDL